MSGLIDWFTTNFKNTKNEPSTPASADVDPLGSLTGYRTNDSPVIERKTDTSVNDAETAKLLRQQEIAQESGTQVAAGNGSVYPRVKRTSKKNVLNSYRSYTYNFTLAAIRKEGLDDPTTYRNDPSQMYVVAKSSGKGSSLLQTNNPNTTLIAAFARKQTAINDPRRIDFNGVDPGTRNYSNEFFADYNQNSAGRFDFYINNVEINSIIGGNEKTSMSTATAISFEIFEPYSMSGFFEALQMTAIAAGHEQYVGAPFLLKVEFLGYPDSEFLPNSATKIDSADKYIPFMFTGVEMEVTFEGTRYKCTGVPYNEKAFGEPSKLKTNIQVTGNTVGDILKSLENSINDYERKAATSERGTASDADRDRYLIVFPEVTNVGIGSDQTVNSIAKSKVTELLKTNETYAFQDPGDETYKNKASQKGGYVPINTSAFFAERSSIYECIASIIRDSEYVKDILLNYEKKVSTDPMIDYFIIQVETRIIGLNKTKNTPYFEYKYVVIPYKIHCSRIPFAQRDTIDQSKVFLAVEREYNYIYSGLNTEIEKFNLKFNSLFFQSIPKGLGDNLSQNSAAASAGLNQGTKVTLQEIPIDTVDKSKAGRAPTEVDVEQNNIHVGGTMNAKKPQYSAYAALAKNMHQAVLMNVDQCTAEIDIVGDPYYLTMGNLGNYRPKLNSFQITLDDEAAVGFSDNIILITFKNPIDIDPTTGEMIFDKKVSFYSGLFRVIEVTSSFKDGVFTQHLNLIRIPAQYDDTGQIPTETPTGAITTTADPNTIPPSSSQTTS